MLPDKQTKDMWRWVKPYVQQDYDPVHSHICSVDDVAMDMHTR
jgi:hypothetical protein